MQTLSQAEILCVTGASSNEAYETHSSDSDECFGHDALSASNSSLPQRYQFFSTFVSQVFNPWLGAISALPGSFQAGALNQYTNALNTVIKALLR